MRHSFTAVLSRNEQFTSDFETEPYEVGWAGEARLFVHVLEMSGPDASWTCTVQVSPDGIFWCDLGTDSLVVDQAGLFTRSFHDFGNWVRIRATASSQDAMLRPIVYLALKE